MSVDVFWIPCDEPGRIGIATRPRGGEWLKDDMLFLHNAGTNLLISMLTPEESYELQLEMEEELCQKEGMNYQSVPIPDRGVPSTRKNVAELALQWAKLLKSGTNIVVHCRQGIGRSAVMVALVLVTCGMKVDLAFQAIAKARGRSVPDTEEQRAWVEQYAASLHSVNSLKVAERMEPYKPAPNIQAEPIEPEITKAPEQAQSGKGGSLSRPPHTN